MEQDCLIVKGVHPARTEPGSLSTDGTWLETEQVIAAFLRIS